MEILSSPETSALIANIVVSVIGLLTTVIVGAGLRFLRSKLTAQQFELLQEIATTVVQAVEQTSLNQPIMDKKAEALRVISEILASKGVNVSPEAIEAAIEAAVLNEFNRPAAMELSYAKAQAIANAPTEAQG